MQMVMGLGRRWLCGEVGRGARWARLWHGLNIAGGYHVAHAQQV